MTEESDRLLFPHKTVRPIQQELLALIDSCIREKRCLIANAPTGLGKTAASLAPAVSHAIKENLTVFFLTSRHTQHRIAVETLKKIKQRHKVNFTFADIIGKKWMCLQEGAVASYSREFTEYCRTLREAGMCEYYNNFKHNTAVTDQAKQLVSQMAQMPGLQTEDIVDLSRSAKICPYEMAALLAGESKVIIADYYYIFNPAIRNSFLARTKKDLAKAILIIDEAHNLPSRIRDLLSEKLTNVTLQRASSEAARFGFEQESKDLRAIEDTLFEIAEEQNGEQEVSREEFIDQIKKTVDYEEAIGNFTLVAEEVRTKQKFSLAGSVAGFMQAWQGEDEGFARILSRYNNQITLSYRCLDPALVSREIFHQVHSAILMSGTLNPTSMYRDVLAFPESAVEKTFPSPFPEENRLAMVIPETTTKFDQRNPAEYKRIAEKLSELFSLIKGNVAAYFPSYRLMDEVKAQLKSAKPVFSEKPGMDKKEKNELLEAFKARSNTGAALLAVASGSFAEGIDLPGDFLKGVIVVGLPLQTPDFETKALIQHYQDKFELGWDYGYVFPAFNRVLQSAGRCIRSETDKGVIIFLDERYAQPHYYRCFPAGWKVIITRLYQDKIKDFFS